MTDVLIAFGANLGDTRATLAAAEARLAALPYVENLRRGACIQTQPVGGKPGDPDYLNTVFRLDVAEGVTPHALLAALLKIESELGRVRGERWAARMIDLDLLLFGEQVVNDPPRLVVPHPLMAQRRFVLEPAMSVAADMRHPLTGKTLEELAEPLRKIDDGAQEQQPEA